MKKSVTYKNLTEAFGGESMAFQKYTYFASIARAHGDEETAHLFEETAAQELQHAQAHLKLLYPESEMDVVKALKMAIEGETYEYTTMYPEFYKKAAEEKDAQAQKEIQEQIAESKEHAGIFSAQLEKAAKRFDALTRVEKRHAGQYENQLNKVKGA